MILRVLPAPNALTDRRRPSPATEPLVAKYLPHRQMRFLGDGTVALRAVQPEQWLRKLNSRDAHGRARRAISSAANAESP